MRRTWSLNRRTIDRYEELQQYRLGGRNNVLLAATGRGGLTTMESPSLDWKKAYSLKHSYA